MLQRLANLRLALRGRCCLLAWSIAAPGLATTLELTTFWRPEGKSEFVFFAGERELCRFSGHSPAHEPQQGVCRFELPAEAKSLTVRGRFVSPTIARNGSEGTPRFATGELVLPLRDAAPLVRPLRDRTLSIAERFRRAMAAEAALVATYDGLSLLEVEARASQAQLSAAEKRLGFALPVAYRELVTTLGAVRVGDHAVPPPERLRPADETILSEWSYGDEGIPRWLTPGARERLRRSVVLFVEAGDGVSAQLFVAPPNGHCQDGFATTFFHEADLAEAMSELVAGNLDCTPFDEVLADLVAGHLLDDHEDALEEHGHQLLIDSSAATLELHLRFAAGPEPEPEFRVTLSRD